MDEVIELAVVSSE
jgi:hypothetical protein